MQVKKIKQFHKDGYTIFRNVFSIDEVIKIREKVFQSWNARQKGDIRRSDILGDDYLKEYIYDERLLNIARQILNKKNIVYFGDSNYAILGKNYSKDNVGGWHRDNTDRSDIKAPDWQSPYTLIRFGIYLQDHSCSSGGIMMKKGSHNRILRGPKNHFIERYMNTALGDVAVWNMRTQHAGLGRCYKLFSSFALGPYMQKKIPRIFVAPENEQERAAFWVAYGLNDNHLKRHCDYLMTRKERKDIWQNSYYNADTIEECTKRGLHVVNMPERMRHALANGEYLAMHDNHKAMSY